jgi:hypothetical protein
VLALSAALAPSASSALPYTILDRLCIGELLEPPPFRTAPVPVGCELVDCCPGCPGAGALEWRVNIDSGYLSGAEVRFEGLTANELKQLKLTGKAKLAGDRILLGPGPSRIRGLPRRGGDAVPVGLIQPFASKESAARLSSLFAKGKLPETESITDHLLVQQYLGPNLVNSFDWRFVFWWCRKPPVPPQPGKDKLKVQGIAPGDEVVVLMDARTSAGCQDGTGSSLQWVFKTTGEHTFADNLLSPGSCNSEIAIFSKKHAMKWETAVPWTNTAGDVHSVTLDPLLEPEVHIWVVDDATAAIAQQHFDKARDLFLDNRVGVQFKPRIRKLSDVSADPNAFQIVKNGINSTGSTCLDAISVIKTTTFYTANTLNVYYVDRSFTGKNCAIKSTPTSCPSSAAMGDANITYVGSTASLTTLAHELGHAYGLRPAICQGHTEGVPGFGPDNLMCTGSTCSNRSTLTLGQVYRMNTHIDLWGGTMLIPNSIPARAPRPCAPNAPLSNVCPRLNLQWP